MTFLGPGPLKVRFAFLGIALGGLILDQVTKIWIRMEFAPRDLRPVIPGFFSLTFHRNTGGAFGLLQGLGEGGRSFVFLLIPAVIIVVIILWALRTPARPLLPQISLACILGGALGNMTDRLRWGYVVDFLYFHLGKTGWVWPAFNVADSFITCGVAVLLIHQFAEVRKETAASRARPRNR